jgi:hypothetical protein
VQPLAKRAAERLALLHSGVRQKTYRTELAVRRIEPVRAAVDKVNGALV